MSSTFPKGHIIGKYEVVRLIAEGGMGAVYEVIHTVLERRDALKIMLPEYARKQDLRARFVREAKATNRVRHPGIVQIYEISELPDGTPYFVMEYLEGETLAARMDRAAEASIGVAGLGPLRQVASIIALCHEKGLIHRDLKPNNIMLVQDPDIPGGERVKLLDFGIVKVQEQPGQGNGRANMSEPLTQVDKILGTPDYMAPEMWMAGKPITGKADVYALGVMAYRTLAGVLPFAAESTLALATKHVFENPVPLQEVVPGLPLELCRLVDRMLAKSAQDRPSMADIIAALDQFPGVPRAPAGTAQIDIPDSFSTAMQVPLELQNAGNGSKESGSHSGQRLETPRVTPESTSAPPKSSSPAHAATISTSGQPFVQSQRPAPPDAATARGNEPPHQTISLDFAALATNASDQKAHAAPSPSFSHTANMLDKLPPKPRRWWLWLSLIGIGALGAGTYLFINNPIINNPNNRDASRETGDMEAVAHQPLPAPPADAAAPVDAAEAIDARSSDGLASADMLALTDASTKPDDGPPHDLAQGQHKVVPSYVDPQSVTAACIRADGISAQALGLVLQGFKASGTRLVPGQTLILDFKDGSCTVMSPPLSLSSEGRQLLKFSLDGLFRSFSENGKKFSATVTVRCPNKPLSRGQK